MKKTILYILIAVGLAFVGCKKQNDIFAHTVKYEASFDGPQGGSTSYIDENNNTKFSDNSPFNYEFKATKGGKLSIAATNKDIYYTAVVKIYVDNELKATSTGANNKPATASYIIP